MVWIDWAIIAVVAVSCLISLWRGFVREALSLCIWVAACLVTIIFREKLGLLLVDSIETPSVRIGLASAFLFIATLVVGALINNLVGELVRLTGLSGADRLLGMVFGGIRGAIIVLVVVTVLPHLIDVTQDVWWKQSVLIPQFVMLEAWSLDIGERLMVMISDIGV